MYSDTTQVDAVHQMLVRTCAHASTLVWLTPLSPGPLQPCSWKGAVNVTDDVTVHAHAWPFNHSTEWASWSPTTSYMIYIYTACGKQNSTTTCTGTDYLATQWQLRLPVVPLVRARPSPHIIPCAQGNPHSKTRTPPPSDKEAPYHLTGDHCV